ncbi:mechanosensitive ion channel protein MscS [Pseudomonas cavernae]|uniref:Small-conductance mechanosensitive channel n=1 Tax=Pseudomonas cavernae TaxID=2320867 RepID=A0A385Z115_9PSED|nr:mechanosensitive ion channel family protein [Pseudomonas cavernae]AYC31543.1 mechanosensitive ion channel protein MscS [Pseudomonas cavernae]
MLAWLAEHPLLTAATLLALDLLLWQLLPGTQQRWKLLLRIGIFLGYSLLLFNAGLSPLQGAPWPEQLPAHLIATVLLIAWWLLAARTLSLLIGAMLMSRVGHGGRLLQDVLGAIIFLIAVIAAAAYVMQLPVRGLLVTSGALAIIVGLALQSTLGDVFSGIVLNTTKPYQLDDVISIDGTEGKVVEIDWRATRLLTSQGSLAVIPNSLAAKAKILNFSRPSELHGVAISLEFAPQVRPRLVLEALERALQGCRDLLISPQPSVAIKKTATGTLEYEASGFVAAMAHKGAVRNQLYDLAYRHLQACGVLLSTAPSGLSQGRALLESVSLFTSLGADEKLALSEHMRRQEFAAGSIVLASGAVTDYLLIIESGVISVTLSGEGETLEAGRMGPGEVIGEAGILAEAAWPAQFTALTPCVLYRIDKEALEPCLQARREIGEAMAKLLSYRQQHSEALLHDKPVVVEKGGFLRWLRKRARQRWS